MLTLMMTLPLHVQHLSAFFLLEHPEYSDGIAYWDHLGGFVTGIAFIWGTIFYLKYEQARAEVGTEVTDSAENAAAATPEVVPTPQLAADPFTSFLPAASVRAGQPKALPAHDPFASLLPEKLRKQKPKDD